MEEEQIQAQEKEQEEQAQEIENKIKISVIEKMPALRIDHEEITMGMGIPYNVGIFVNEQNNKEKFLKYIADYYFKSAEEFPLMVRKAIYTHIFYLKKPFMLVVPKGELKSKSGGHHVVSNNFDLQETVPYIAKLYRYVKFPSFARLGHFDLQKTKRPYVALIHYNILLLFDYVKPYDSNISIIVKDESVRGGKAEIEGEIPFRPTETAKVGARKGYEVITGKYPFKLFKGNKFYVIYNFGDQENKIKFEDGSFIYIPPGKAYFHLPG
jgi:hypothetical protein